MFRQLKQSSSSRVHRYFSWLLLFIITLCLLPYLLWTFRLPLLTKALTKLQPDWHISCGQWPTLSRIELLCIDTPYALIRLEQIQLFADSDTNPLYLNKILIEHIQLTLQSSRNSSKTAITVPALPKLNIPWFKSVTVEDISVRSEDEPSWPFRYVSAVARFEHEKWQLQWQIGVKSAVLAATSAINSLTVQGHATLTDQLTFSNQGFLQLQDDTPIASLLGSNAYTIELGGQWRDDSVTGVLTLQDRNNPSGPPLLQGQWQWQAQRLQLVDWQSNAAITEAKPIAQAADANNLTMALSAAMKQASITTEPPYRFASDQVSVVLDAELANEQQPQSSANSASIHGEFTDIALNFATSSAQATSQFTVNASNAMMTAMVPTLPKELDSLLTQYPNAHWQLHSQQQLQWQAQSLALHNTNAELAWRTDAEPMNSSQTTAPIQLLTASANWPILTVAVLPSSSTTAHLPAYQQWLPASATLNWQLAKWPLPESGQLTEVTGQLSFTQQPQLFKWSVTGSSQYQQQFAEHPLRLQPSCHAQGQVSNAIVDELAAQSFALTPLLKKLSAEGQCQVSGNFEYRYPINKRMATINEPIQAALNWQYARQQLITQSRLTFGAQSWLTLNSDDIFKMSASSTTHSNGLTWFAGHGQWSTNLAASQHWWPRFAAELTTLNGQWQGQWQLKQPLELTASSNWLSSLAMTGSSELTIMQGKWQEYQWQQLAWLQPWQFSSQQVQLLPTSVTLPSLDIGVTMQQIQSQLTGAISLTPEQFHYELNLSDIHGQVLSGDFLVPHWRLLPAGQSRGEKPSHQQATITFNHLDLAQLASMQQYQGAKLFGQISGQLPVRQQQGLWSLQGGELHNDGPVEIDLRAVAQLDSLLNSQPDLAPVLGHLKHLHASSVTSSVDMDEHGNIDLQLAIKGEHKAEQQPVNLNYRHQENLFMLLKALRLSDQLEQQIQSHLDGKTP